MRRISVRRAQVQVQTTSVRDAFLEFVRDPVPGCGTETAKEKDES